MSSPTVWRVEIVPDAKDWTWVLQRRCGECGLDTRQVEPGDVAGLLRTNSAAWVAVLGSGPTVRQRPAPGVWSALEYACHVRDVFELYDERLQLMLTEADPLFPNWDQDQTAVTDRYSEQDPAVVAVQLATAAGALAARFDDVHGDQWERPGCRSDGARFTVATFARYFIHDPIHHLHDVTGRHHPDRDDD
jgi:DinB superfamily